MDLISDELGIPKHQYFDTDTKDRFILVVHKTWLKKLKQEKKIFNFPTYGREFSSTLSNNKLLPELIEPWTKIYVQNYSKKPNVKVFGIQQQLQQSDSSSDLLLTYSEVITQITNGNFKKQWETAYKQYHGGHIKYSKPNLGAINKKSDLNVLPYDQVLRETIQKIFSCSIIQSKSDRIKLPMDMNIINIEEDESHVNIMGALCAIETHSSISILFYPKFIKTSLYDCITYSPALLNKSVHKVLFILYQLFKLIKYLHQKNLLIGNIRLNDIYLTDNLWLEVIPNLEANLIQLDNVAVPQECYTPTPEEKFDLKFAYDLQQFSLKDYCEMWCHGQLSNYDYLTILNNAAGRKLGCPGNHHIMPWVTDFLQRNGVNWRDLTKSKYRLNKGDAHLDLMFNTVGTQNDLTASANFLNAKKNSDRILGINSSINNLPPHHVTDFLSEITYFVYMARRTPQNILCQHVRPNWVPAEYPISIQRLQEWTPDECIPEFYSNPMIFKSIHEDLPDLELPTWATCPEDFIAKHREALESQYVSERLHHWIDLNFGYKLCGKSAIKAKNVCLSIVDNHKNLTNHGIVQLFSHAHPSKRFPSKYFGKIPPKITYNEQNQYKVLTRSTENLVEMSHRQSRRTSPSPNRVRLSSSNRLSTSSNLNTTEEILNTMERSYSVHQNLSNTIYLPKDFNPLALLTNYEHMESFFSKTFHTPKLKSEELSEKLEQNDLLFEDLTDNSFENRIFTESFEITAVPEQKHSKRNSKLVLPSQPISKSVYQIIEDEKTKDLENIGCVIVELFLMNRSRVLTTTKSKVQRLQACKLLAKKYQKDIPKCLQILIKKLLKLEVNHEIEEMITAKNILEPLYNLVPFPIDYYRFYNALICFNSFDRNFILLNLYTHFDCNGKDCQNFIDLDQRRMVFTRKISECKVNAFCKQINGLLEPTAFEQFNCIELILPFFIDLLSYGEESAILSAWCLFDPIASALGVNGTKKYLLNPILQLYESDLSNEKIFCTSNSRDFPDSNNIIKFRSSSTFKSRKTVKLYHHSFLLKLLQRFGLKCFLDNFIQPLIEAVAGLKEPIESTGYHYHKTGAINKTVISSSDNDGIVTEKSLSEIKCEIEEVFSFESEESLDVNIKYNIENQSVNSFDMQRAEEATEEILLAEKLAINDLFSPGSLSNNSFDEDKLSFDSKGSPKTLHETSGPKSPTIQIPSTYRRTYELSTIDCEIGSKKSFDSFDFGQDTEKLKCYQKSEISMDEEKPSTSKFDKFPNSRKQSLVDQNDRISEMSMESVIWLSFRLGPVLSSKHLTRNLLRILALCYAGQENLLPANYEDTLKLHYFSIADAKVIGDRNAEKILQCLSSISALYGDQLILLQYLPHIGELVALCKRKIITPSLEGALISSLQLVKYIIPCLSDSVLMENLQDLILQNILNPILSIVGSTRSLFANGFLGRSVAIRKFLDSLYVICSRIGVEMSRECIPILQKYFLIFDKAYGIRNNFEINNSFESNARNELNISPFLILNTDTEDNEINFREKAIEEIRDVFVPNLAHTSYLEFLKLFGETFMEKNCINLEFILTLCHEYEQPSEEKVDNDNRGINILNRKLSNDQSSVTEEDLSHSFGTSVIGNRIEVAKSTKKKLEIGPVEILDMVANKFEKVNNNRHLYGNWLAYWRSEIGRSEKDTIFNIKQIKLQTFVGHTNTVRSILSLDNENSFMSASKDKTVKLWSLRNEGDGKKQSTCQYTYNFHKKSVHSVAYMETMRLVASCDSGIHFWDPFIGRPLGILDSHRNHCPVSIVKSYPSPSPLLIAGTQESTIKMIDTRVLQYINEWKVSTMPNSTVRCLAIAPSGNWIAVGLSTGNITLLDARTGIVLRSWKSTDAELLQLVAANDHQIISSSLDYSLAVWNISENYSQHQLKQPQEPAHCLYANTSELIWATPANRIGVYNNFNSTDLPFTTKLRSETLKGVLTSFTVLPLNHMFLSGNDSGNIILFC